MNFRPFILAGLLVTTFAGMASESHALESPWIRIRLFADQTVQELRLSSAEGLRIGSRRYTGPCTVNIRNHRLWVSSPGQATRPARKVIITSPANEILLQAGLSSRRISGDVEITQRGSRGLQIIGTMDAESYVLGVIEPELGTLAAPPESLKAQIVASRSYLLAMRGRHASKGYDFCDTPHCQTFRGLDAIKPVLLEAAGSVRGKYLIYHQHPVPAFYHDNCGGMTAAADQVWPVASLPYLRPVHDGHYCRQAPHAQWHWGLSEQSLQKILVENGLLPANASLQNLAINRRDDSGRVQTLQLMLTEGTDRRMSAKALRQALNRHFGEEVIPSLLFTIHRQDGRFVFNGRGWGHGVGLCQWGAMEMAREGKTYQQILEHYYPGTRVDQLTEPLLASSDDSNMARTRKLPG